MRNANQDVTWSAQWIWLGEGEDSDVMLTRKEFAFTGEPQRSLCAITASSQYKLYVNGDFVATGPARCAAHHQSYDTHDISEYLVNSENVIAVEVHYQKNNVSYMHQSRGGLLCQVDFGETQIISDDSWKVAFDPTWCNQSPGMSYAHMEVVDRRDLRLSIGDWKSVNYDDATWANARVLKREEGWPLPQEDEDPGHLVPPWTALIPRDSPYLKYDKVPFQECLQKGYLSDAQTERDWLNLSDIEEIEVEKLPVSKPFDLPRVISLSGGDDAPFVLFDLNEVHNACTYLDIEGPEGTVIDFLSVPFLLDGKLFSPLLGSHYVDRIVLSGNKDQWEAQYWKPIRYLAMIVRRTGTGGTSVNIHDIGLRKKTYPFEMKGCLVIPDFPELEQLYHASAATIRVATTDAYTDNYRERRQYAQTAYYACMGNYHLFGDTALQRRYLIQIAQEQMPNGIMPAYAPCHGDDYMVILDSNCFWLRGLYQYLIYSGDKEPVLRLLPTACKLLDLFDSFSNDDALIDSPPYPYWLDHTVLDRRGANLCLNTHYLGGLEDFVKVLKLLDKNGMAFIDVEKLEARCVKIRQAIQRDFWHDEAELFVDAVIDGEQSAHFSEHCQAMVLALGIASDEQRGRIVEKLLTKDDEDLITRKSGMTVVTPAMSYFLHAGLCEAGEVDASMKMLWRRFKHMLEPEHNGTLWEEWWLNGSGRQGKFKYIQGRSDAQTESAFPPALFFRYVLGIEPVEIGMAEVLLNYYPSDKLKERKGAMSTPSGKLSVEWQVSKKRYMINLSIPENTVLKVNLNSMKDAVLDRIVKNGEGYSDRVEDFVRLEWGKHNVEIPRRG